MNSGDKKLSNEVDSTQNDKAEDDNIEIDEKIIESKPKNCYNQIVDDEEDNDGIKFVIYKQKKPKNESDQSAPKIVRTEQERRLFNSLCQNCQNYYSARSLSYETLRDLLDRCGKHRGYRSAYKSPPRFWNIDFDED
uniref:DNA endonuclease activator Ctp1 C-terminal domain-containing protein n=1 Tax=Sarcoptes scabiei TaxID=52283 RepID=A0A834R260_SARSC